MTAERAFVDTNLFLRYLTNDVPEQADLVEQLIRRAASGEVVLVTNSMVIAEIVWVLERYYEIDRCEVRDKIMSILSTPGLEVADTRVVVQAVSWYADRNIDFIDAFNAAWLLAQGMETIYTFDHKHFQRIPQLRMGVPQVP